MTLASIAPPFAVRCVNDVMDVLVGLPVEELSLNKILHTVYNIYR
jgi:hypothetical protein